MDKATLLIALKLAVSLAAVLGMAWFARWLGLGGDVRIRDADHAMQIAKDGLYGFRASDVGLDRAGYSALLRDADENHVLIAKVGNGFAVRRLTKSSTARLDQRFLTIDLHEPDFAPATLNLGEEAQQWASGLRRLRHA